ncbi:DUF4190 domain-containing protein [Kineosporia sp. R_H_3]|uniref:DUF4190 domain-containing protein n=1 Tax=Kineosporia sp. R_H_3 TaxID=1961848 RepID=UPI001179962B|nr:DUF4190 domain-containing protein [Kineosporia sp. R_H_3]
MSERVFGPMDGSTEGLPGLVLLPEQETRPAERTSKIAVAALVTGIVGLVPVSVPLGIAGLVRTKRPGVGGRRLALTGLALSGLWTVAVVAVLVFAVFLGQQLTSPSGDTAGDPAAVAAQDGLTKSGAEVEQGDCLLAWDATTLTADADPDVVAVDCTNPHQAQAFGEVDLSDTYADGAAYPGPAALVTSSEEGCRLQAPTALVESATTMPLSGIPPTAADWAEGSRTVLCLVVSGSADLTASVTP